MTTAAAPVEVAPKHAPEMVNRALKILHTFQYSNNVSQSLIQDAEPITFGEFVQALQNFRDRWGDRSFWKQPYEKQIEEIFVVISRFTRMDGTFEQIKSAGTALTALAYEFKMRRAVIINNHLV